MVSFLIEACADSCHLPLPRRDARRLLQRKYGPQDAGGYTVRQQSSELCFEITQFRTCVIAEPISQGAETPSGFRLASAAIESWATQIQSAEWRPVAHTVRTVSAQRRLIARARRS